MKAPQFLFIALVLTLFLAIYLSKLDTKLTLNKLKIEYLSSDIEQTEERLQTMISEQNEHIDELDNKVFEFEIRQ